MKPNSTLTGVLVALIVGLLVLGARSTNDAISQGIVGMIIMIPVAYFGIRYRIQVTNKNESMAQRGLDHYRYHHHRRVIKKTS